MDEKSRSLSFPTRVEDVMLRYKIAPLMVVILYMAIGFGALFNPMTDWIWSSTIYSLTSFVMTTSTLLAFLRRGSGRAWLPPPRRTARAGCVRSLSW
jgi:hypothetical protein